MRREGCKPNSKGHCKLRAEKHRRRPKTSLLRITNILRALQNFVPRQPVRFSCRICSPRECISWSTLSSIRPIELLRSWTSPVLGRRYQSSVTGRGCQFWRPRAQRCQLPVGAVWQGLRTTVCQPRTVHSELRTPVLLVRGPRSSTFWTVVGGGSTVSSNSIQ